MLERGDLRHRNWPRTKRAVDGNDPSEKTTPKVPSQVLDAGRMKDVTARERRAALTPQKNVSTYGTEVLVVLDATRLSWLTRRRRSRNARHWCRSGPSDALRAVGRSMLVMRALLVVTPDPEAI